jgi:hypothetical protein
MQNVITIGRALVPVEQIAYVEAIEPPADGRFKPDKTYKSRIVLLNRETGLCEVTPQEFADANWFRLLPEDNVATNPGIDFRVESIVPTKDFDPGKPYQTRLVWRGLDGLNRFKLRPHQARNGHRDRIARRDRTRRRSQGAATSPGSAARAPQAVNPSRRGVEPAASKEAQARTLPVRTGRVF